MEKRYIFSMLVNNRVGVLNRISGLITRRGVNISSVSAVETEEEGITLMVVGFDAEQKIAEHVLKQLAKQVDVLEIRKLNVPEAVTREHVMVKVSTTIEQRSAIISLAKIFRANIVDISPESMIVELTGESSKTNAFLETVRPYGIVEVARSAMIGMQRKGAPNPRNVLSY